MKFKRKRRNIPGTTTDNDRLSSLPDSLRLHILSFVPTKYAARTSLLSRKWRDLFLDAPRIELEYSPPAGDSFDNLGVDDYDLPGHSNSLRKGNDAEFVRFISRRLMLGSLPPPCIDEFRLICPTLLKSSCIDVWLTILLRRGIKVLEIEQVDPNGLGFRSQNRYPYHPSRYPPRYYPHGNPLGYADHHHGYPGYVPVAKLLGDPLYPPTGFFQSKTLVVLRFRGGTLSFDSRESACFPNLKVLSLESLTIHLTSETLRFNELGYPVLEDLELKKLVSRGKVIIEISSQTLKKAAIVHLNPPEFTRIDIVAPHLQHLECKDIGRGISLSECGNLESGVFCMCSPAGFDREAFIKTLSNVRNLKRLDMDLTWSHEMENELVGSLPEIPNLPDLVGSLPEFQNLTYLGFQHDDFLVGSKQFLLALLHRAPNLEKLSFNMNALFERQMSPSPEILPECFGRKLRVISLQRCSGTEAQVALVEWLLNLQGAVVEKIVVQGKSKEWPASTMNRLLRIAQIHPKCEIVILED